MNAGRHGEYAAVVVRGDRPHLRRDRDGQTSSLRSPPRSANVGLRSAKAGLTAPKAG